MPVEEKECIEVYNSYQEYFYSVPPQETGATTQL